MFACNRRKLWPSILIVDHGDERFENASEMETIVNLDLALWGEGLKQDLPLLFLLSEKGKIRKDGCLFVHAEA